MRLIHPLVALAAAGLFVHAASCGDDDVYIIPSTNDLSGGVEDASTDAPNDGRVSVCGESENPVATSFSGECVPTARECYANDLKNEGAGAECLAKHDNQDCDLWTGRFTYIEVKTPRVLASALVATILNDGLALNQPACAESGQGTFSWLLQYDPVTQTLKTGGGDPVDDPQAGTCFVNLPHPTNPALDAKPIEVAVPVAEDGSFSAQVPGVVVPVFLDVEKTSTILLPLHEIEFNGTFSEDRNCIGKSKLGRSRQANLCLPDEGGGTWEPGGDLKGYITITEADEVFIDDLNTSLCALVAADPDWKGPGGYCSTTAAWEAGMRPPGDWCSETNSAGGCGDAWRLEASFAGSAMKINGDCPG